MTRGGDIITVRILGYGGFSFRIIMRAASKLNTQASRMHDSSVSLGNQAGTGFSFLHSNAASPPH